MAGGRKRRKHLVPQLMQPWAFNNEKRNNALRQTIDPCKPVLPPTHFSFSFPQELATLCCPILFPIIIISRLGMLESTTNVYF